MKLSLAVGAVSATIGVCKARIKRAGPFLVIIVMSLSSAAAADEADCRLMVLGDSLSAGYGLDVGEDYVTRLGEALEQHSLSCEMINAGVSGDTMAGGSARLDWALADNPSHVIVELGGNDALRALPVSGLREHLTSIVSRLQAMSIPTLIMGMLPPPNLGEDYFNDFRDAYSDISSQYNAAFYPFFLDGVAGQTELNQSDGIHPNNAGVAVLVENTLPFVKVWLEETRTQ